MNIKAILQSLYYISKKLNKSVDKLTALKLLYFADKYHLLYYNRLITDDKYYAMKFGPVASNAKNILDFSNINNEQKSIKKFILPVGKNKYKAVDKNLKLDYLSESDKEALDFSIEKFAKYKPFQLAEITHKYPEWNRFESILTDDLKRIEMNIEDFFEVSDWADDPFAGIPQDIRKIGKDFYLGFF